MNFSDEVFTIDAAVRKSGFPVVVKSENASSDNGDYFENCLKLPNSITMLERWITLQFALVTVMGFRDPDKILAERGMSFVESHSEYEDNDFLLPLAYPGTCRIVHPPGRGKRYASIAEVIITLIMHRVGSDSDLQCFCLFCLIGFFTSHQQSFSYKGKVLPGLNQYLVRINVLLNDTMQ